MHVRNVSLSSARIFCTSFPSHTTSTSRPTNHCQRHLHILCSLTHPTQRLRQLRARQTCSTPRLYSSFVSFWLARFSDIGCCIGLSRRRRSTIGLRMLRTRKRGGIYGGGEGGRKKEGQLEREGLGAIVECRLGLEVLLGYGFVGRLAMNKAER